MSIIIDTDTRVVVQGITGNEGRFHTQSMLRYGTRIVAGVTPGKGGRQVENIPVYNTVAEAVSSHGADTSIIFVPPRFTPDAVFEAINAGIRKLVVITELIPQKDAIEFIARAHKNNIPVGVSVNLSPSTLLDPELPDVITGLLASHKLPTGTLTLEITETSIVKDPNLAMEVLIRLADMGINISIDDFGTGYSSLSYLKKMPASEVKIDKSFVMDMLENESDAVIVKATIDLAHNLGMKVVAEGVENQHIVDRLKELGCDILQGYHYSKPLSDNDFVKWFSSWNVR